MGLLIALTIAVAALQRNRMRTGLTMLGLVVPTILYCWFFDYLAMVAHLH